MRIDIHFGWVHLQEQEDDGETSFGHQAPIGFVHRMIDRAVLDGAAVEEQELPAPVGPVDGRQTRVALDIQLGAAALEVDERVHELAAIEFGDSLKPVRRRAIEDLLAVARQPKVDARIGQGHLRDTVRNAGRFACR